jgi:hypothetical protein
MSTASDQFEDFTIPLPSKRRALLRLPTRLTEAEYRQFIDTLEVMRPALTRDAADESNDASHAARASGSSDRE